MGINTVCEPVLFQKAVGCCWVSLPLSDFQDESNGVWQWNPGFDAGECPIQYFCDASGDPEPWEDVSATGLMVVKDADVSGLSVPAVPGEVIEYTFTVSNVGSVPISNIIVADPLLTVSGGPITLGVGATDSVTFTGTYVLTAADVAAGVVSNIASVSGVDPDGDPVTADSNTIDVLLASLINRAVGLDSPLTVTVDAGDPVDFSAFTCSDGTPIDEWQISFDDGTTWYTIPFSQLTSGNLIFDCTKLRFRCDGDWSDAELTYDIVAADTYQDTTFNIDQGLSPFFSVCYPCGTNNQIWRYRIDDAYADESHPDNPNIVVGDRVNSDPGTPTPDDAWQPVTYTSKCNDCVTFNVEEFWPDGVDFDPGVQLNEFFVFYLQVSCDNGASWQPEIKIILQS